MFYLVLDLMHEKQRKFRFILYDITLLFICNVNTFFYQGNVVNKDGETDEDIHKKQE